MRYSVQPRDRIFAKGYGFMSFAKNMGKNIGKNISKNVSGKYSQKLLGHAKQLTTDALKTTSKRLIQKAAEAISDLIGKKLLIKPQIFRKIYNKVIQRQLLMRIIKKYIKKDIYIMKKRQEITDNLRLI